MWGDPTTEKLHQLVTSLVTIISSSEGPLHLQRPQFPQLQLAKLGDLETGDLETGVIEEEVGIAGEHRIHAVESDLRYILHGIPSDWSSG